MKSKNDAIHDLGEILRHVLLAVSKWREIRDIIGEKLEESIDHLDPKIVERLAGFFELLDEMNNYFSDIAGLTKIFSVDT